MISMKPSIKDLKPYKASPYEVSIRLHANETKNYLYKDGYPVINDLSIYPNSNASFLQEKIAEKYDITSDQVIVGNGSSEVIDIAMKTYLQPGDTVLTFSPTFVMYEIYAKQHNAVIKTVKANYDFTQPIQAMVKAIKEYNPTITILCTPNNPTGDLIQKKDVIKIVKASKSLVIVDEAYMEFNTYDTSVIKEINTYDNLLVLRTFSKAYGLAAIRLGYGVASSSIINQLLAVKPPYNVNSISQAIGLDALTKENLVKNFTSGIQKNREDLYNKLGTLPLDVFPSQGNFLYCYIDKEGLFDELIKRDILIRKYSGVYEGYYRITIGTKVENKAVYTALKEVLTCNQSESQEQQEKQV